MSQQATTTCENPKTTIVDREQFFFLFQAARPRYSHNDCHGMLPEPIDATLKRANVKMWKRLPVLKTGFGMESFRKVRAELFSYVQCLNPAPQDVEARFVGWLLPAAGLPQVVALLTEELVDNRS